MKGLEPCPSEPPTAPASASVSSVLIGVQALVVADVPRPRYLLEPLGETPIDRGTELLFDQTPSDKSARHLQRGRLIHELHGDLEPGWS